MNFFDRFDFDVELSALRKLAAASKGSTGSPAGAKSTAQAGTPGKANMAAPTNKIVPQVDAMHLGGAQSIQQTPVQNSVITQPQSVMPQPTAMPVQFGIPAALQPAVQKAAEMKLALALKQVGPNRLMGLTENGTIRPGDPVVPNSAPNSNQTRTLKPLDNGMGYQAPQHVPWTGASIPMNQ